MSKYAPLKIHLLAQVTEDVPMTFAEIEAVLRAKLPASAYRHRPWWANEAPGHVHCQAWLEAGFETSQVDMPGQKLVFRRLAASAASTRPDRDEPEGMREESLPWRSVATAGRHPLFGALKGTFAVETERRAGESRTAGDLLSKARLIAGGLPTGVPG